MNYKEAITKLNFDNVSFEELPVKVGEKINDIITEYLEFSDEIIENLPDNIKLVYLIGELESAILYDGLLSIFYNNTLKEIERYEKAIQKTESKKLLQLFLKAKALVSKEYTLKQDKTFLEAFPDKDVYDFFSESLIEIIENIEEKITELQDKGEYWNRIENQFQSKN
ncbi:hypothetical protein LJB84_00640 [Bacteroidales bacterium OttesenSCG-928-J19]|nr:hypothetical protein [Bacteroidales bacterium OttesenSCG-928-J19]